MTRKNQLSPLPDAKGKKKRPSSKVAIRSPTRAGELRANTRVSKEQTSQPAHQQHARQQHATPHRSVRRSPPLGKWAERGLAQIVAHRSRVTIQSDGLFPSIPTHATLRRWVRLALESTPQAQITLRLVNTREGRRLNREFRHRDYATNVLTFGYEPPPQLAADIVLCVPVIAREARAQSKPLRAHLAHLTVHGVLHARGFNHLRSDERQRMERREITLLKVLRISNPYVLSTPLS